MIGQSRSLLSAGAIPMHKRPVIMRPLAYGIQPSPDDYSILLRGWICLQCTKWRACWPNVRHVWTLVAQLFQLDSAG